MKDEEDIDEILGDIMPGGDTPKSDDEIEILGTTKIARRWRISLIKQVREELGEGGESIEIGDRIVLRKSGGKIVIESA